MDLNKAIDRKRKANEKKPAPAKSLVELGNIMLAQAGAEACQKGYGTTDPYWVGIHALSFCDINRDGTLN
jgi:hypothetical protein